MNLASSIENLSSTSSITIRKFKSLGINTYLDLLNYFPSRYEDFSLISPINKIQPGETVTIIGKVIDAKYQVTRNRLRVQVFKIEDETGVCGITFFNQPFLLRILNKGLTVSISGTANIFGRMISIEPKEYEIIKEDVILGSEKTNSRRVTSESDSGPLQGKQARMTFLKHTGRIIPIYPEKRGLSSRTIREKMAFVLLNVIPNSFRDVNKNNEMPKQVQHDNVVIPAKEGYSPLREIQEIYPKEITSYNNLIDEEIAYKQIHFPDSSEEAVKAKQRLAFDELFILQLSSKLIKEEWEKEKVGNKFQISNFKFQIDEFINSLPFKLTRAQQLVWNEILRDLQKQKPMNRFLQGEVGSGKTVIAALACYLSYLNGYQSLLMAPTEILAQQHYQTMAKLFQINQKNSADISLHPKPENSDKSDSSDISDLSSLPSSSDVSRTLPGYSEKLPKVALVTGSTKKSKPYSLRPTPFDIIIGTHALISKKINFSKVGLVIVDEQQRFGVVQRSELKSKGLNPHLLTMTATPIPRTVALTLYGELDLSVIDEMPVGRLPVKTYYVPKSKRISGYTWIKSQITNNRSQVFIVCPLIEESDNETMKSVKAAKKEFENLKKIFSEFQLGLLHGRMKSKEKESVMSGFKNGNLDILVTTPVVEVGVDVPKATIMLIEGAERFGLAQLHQLRGRVGRSNKQAYCFLFSEKEDNQVVNRLNFFAATSDGNKLAEEDLKIRGPGNIYGLKQHGYLDLKIASLSDFTMIKTTKKAVEYFVKNYDVNEFPELKKKVEKYKKGVIANN